MRTVLLIILIFSFPLKAREEFDPPCPVIELDLGKVGEPMPYQFRERAKNLLIEIMFPAADKPKPAWWGDFYRRTKRRPLVAAAKVQNLSQTHLDLTTAQASVDKVLQDLSLNERYTLLLEEGAKQAYLRRFQERIDRDEKPSDDDVPNFVLHTELGSQPVKIGEARGREEKVTFTLKASGGTNAACLIVRGRAVL